MLPPSLLSQTNVIHCLLPQHFMLLLFISSSFFLSSLSHSSHIYPHSLTLIYFLFCIEIYWFLFFIFFCCDASYAAVCSRTRSRLKLKIKQSFIAGNNWVGFFFIYICYFTIILSVSLSLSSLLCFATDAAAQSTMGRGRKMFENCNFFFCTFFYSISLSFPSLFTESATLDTLVVLNALCGRKKSSQHTMTYNNLDEFHFIIFVMTNWRYEIGFSHNCFVIKT